MNQVTRELSNFMDISQEVASLQSTKQPLMIVWESQHVKKLSHDFCHSLLCLPSTWRELLCQQLHFTSAALRVLHPSPLHLARNNYVALLYMLTLTALQESLWRARSYHCFLKLHVRAGTFYPGSLLPAQSFKIFSTFVLLPLEINSKMFDQLQKKNQSEKKLPPSSSEGNRSNCSMKCSWMQKQEALHCLQRAVGAVPCLTCLQGPAARVAVRQKTLSSHGPAKHISWQMSFGRRGEAFPSSLSLLGTAQASQW